MKEKSCSQVCPQCFVVRAFHCHLTLSSVASKERSLFSWILLHISHIYSEEERHPAYLDQFPIDTASYCCSVAQSIKFKGYAHPTYFLQEWNPHFYCFFFPEKWPLIAEKYTCCTITAEESSPHCFEELCEQLASSCCWKAGMPHFVLLTLAACSCSWCLWCICQLMYMIILPFI